MKIKQLFKVLPVFVFASSLVSSLFAQSPDDSIKNDVEAKTKLEISVEGLSRAIYAGRNYGVDQFGLNPSITFYHASGLYLSAYSYGMSKTPGLITETDLSASFIFHISKILNITPGYTYIINLADSSDIFNHSLNLSTGLELTFISLNNFISFKFGKSTAWYDEVSASKYISLFSREKTNISLSPTFVWVLGTKQALSSISHGNTVYKAAAYNAIRKGKGKKLGIPSTTTTITTVDTTASFMPLSYEFLIPITFSAHNFSFSLIPHYSIPVNLVPAESTLTGNPFYLTGKLTYTIPFFVNKK